MQQTMYKHHIWILFLDVSAKVFLMSYHGLGSVSRDSHTNFLLKSVLRKEGIHKVKDILSCS